MQLDARPALASELRVTASHHAVTARAADRGGLLRRALPALLALLALVLCPAPTAAQGGGTPGATPASAAAWAAGDCELCHVVPGIAEAGRTESCSGCHAWIREVAADPAKREKAMAVFPLWERYERTTHSYLRVPSLEAAMARLDPDLSLIHI